LALERFLEHDVFKKKMASLMEFPERREVERSWWGDLNPETGIISMIAQFQSGRSFRILR
jgi:hypothetical protein